MKEGTVGGHLGTERQRPGWGWAGDGRVPKGRASGGKICLSLLRKRQGSARRCLCFSPLLAVS